MIIGMDSNDDPVLKRLQTEDFWRLALDCKGKCAYCDLDGSSDYRILANFEIDHLIPRDKGGTNHRSNLVLCCRRCNGDKAHYDPSEGSAPAELTTEQRMQMISRSRGFVAQQRGRYYMLLQAEIQKSSN